MMVLLLFISPQYGSFAYPPPWRYLFLCHISPRSHDRGHPTSRFHSIKKKCRVFRGEITSRVHPNAKKAPFRPMMIYSHWQQEAVLWIFLIYEFYIYHLFTPFSYILFFSGLKGNSKWILIWKIRLSINLIYNLLKSIYTFFLLLTQNRHIKSIINKGRW